MADSFGSKGTLRVGDREYEIFRFDALEREGIDVSRLPYSLRILLENLLRTENGVSVTREDIEALAKWQPKADPDKEIAFTPARVILQDFTGVPAIVDLAAMRDAMARLGGDPKRSTRCSPWSWWSTTRYRSTRSVRPRRSGSTRSWTTSETWSATPF